MRHARPDGHAKSSHIRALSTAQPLLDRREEIDTARQRLVAWLSANRAR
jgi:hypothetical protein